MQIESWYYCPTCHLFWHPVAINSIYERWYCATYIMEEIREKKKCPECK